MSPSGDSPNMLQLSVLISLMPQSKKKSVLKEHVGILQETVTTIQRTMDQRIFEGPWFIQQTSIVTKLAKNGMGKHLANLISPRSQAGRPRMALAIFTPYVINNPSRKPSAIYVFVLLFLIIFQSLSLCPFLPSLPSPLFETGFLCLAQSVLELSEQTRLPSSLEICLPPDCQD